LPGVEHQLFASTAQRGAGSKEGTRRSRTPQGRVDRSDRRTGSAKRSRGDSGEEIQAGPEGLEIPVVESAGEVGDWRKVNVGALYERPFFLESTEYGRS